MIMIKNLLAWNSISFLNVNKRLKFWLIPVLVLMAPLTHAQSKDSLFADRPMSSVNFNLLGDASYLSINYEYIFFNEAYVFLTAEVGLGYNRDWSFCISRLGCKKEAALVTIPFHFTANFGDGNHFFEGGLGVVRVLGDTPYKFIAYPQIGYRYIPAEPSNPNFKIYIQAVELFGFDITKAYFFPAGISVGFSF